MAGKNLGVTAICTVRKGGLGMMQTMIASVKAAIWLQSTPKQRMILSATWHHHGFGLEHQTWRER